MIIIKILVIVSSWPVGLGLTDNKNFRGLTQSGIGLSVPPGLFGQGRHVAPLKRGKDENGGDKGRKNDR